MARAIARDALLFIGVVATSVACGSRDRTSPAHTVVDSAGVQIVANAAPALPDGVAGIVDDDFTLSIGDDEAGGPGTFGRIAGVTQLADGTIVVLDGMSAELRYFTPDAVLARTAGGLGGGPGELRAPEAMFRGRADTIAVSDVTRRAHLFDARGRIARVVRLAPHDSVRNARAILQAGDGTLLARAAAWSGYTARDAGRHLRDTIGLVLYSPDGADPMLMMRVPAHRRWGYHVRGAFRAPYMPFTVAPSTAAGGSYFVAGDGESAELMVWSTDGTLRRIVRWSVTPRSVGGDEISSFGAAYRDRLATFGLDGPSAPAEANAWLASTPYPERMPVFQRLVVAADGEVWVERYRAPWEHDEAPTWDVFSAVGAWEGHVRTPPGFELYEVHADGVLGVWRDAMDVEHVRRHPLRRRAAPPSGDRGP